MKKLLFSFVIFPTLIFSQCPDSKSNEYKQKASQYSDASYTTLATYYYYKCQCENGIGNRTPAQVNALVKQYNTFKANKAGVENSISLPNQHQVEWVNINTVTKCSKHIETSNNGSIDSHKSNSNTKSDLNQALNQSQSIVSDLIKGNNNDAGNKSIAMSLQGAIEGNNKKVVGGIALGLVSLFSKSKARESKPLTLKELERIKNLDKRRYRSIIKNAFNESTNEYGFSMPNDTTFIRVGDGKKTIMTHKPIKDATKWFVNSIKKYNIYSGELEEEAVVESHHPNSTNKLFTINNYVRGFSRLIEQDENKNSIKVVDLITDEIIFDKNQSSKETIFDENHREIGIRIIYNNQTYKEQYFEKKVLIREIIFSEGVKEIESTFDYIKGNRIASIVILYNNRGLKTKKWEASYKELAKGNSTITFYTNNKPSKKVIYKNGSKHKEFLYN